VQGMHLREVTGRRLLPALLAVAVAVLFAAPAQSMAAGGIAGTVTYSGGYPASGAGVTVVSDGSSGATQIHTTSAASDGSYAFGGLSAGSYTVCFSPSGVGGGTRFYNNVSSVSSATPVTVSDGSTTSGINASFPYGAQVSGFVKDQTGTPMAGVHVSVREPPCSSFYPAPDVEVSSGTTRSDGGYVAGYLPVGTYKVEFTSPDTSYAPQYYDGKSTDGAADPVSITSTTQDFQINPVMQRANSISGTVRDVSGSGVGQVTVTLYTEAAGGGPGSYVTNTTSTADGRYSFTAVSPGSYVVKFWTLPGGTVEYPTQYYNQTADPARATPIVLGSGSAVMHVDAMLQNGGTVTGKVTTSSGSPIAGAEVDIVDQPGDDLEPVGYARTNPDGTYSVHGLPPGDWYVEFWGRNGTAMELYPGVVAYSDAQTIHVADGATTSGINAALPPAGYVIGKAAMGPGKQAQASATFFQVGSGSPKQLLTIYIYLNPNQWHYWSWALVPGTYIAEFRAPGYQTVWSGGAFSEDQASPFSITAGAETRDIDFLLWPDGVPRPSPPSPASSPASFAWPFAAVKPVLSSLPVLAGASHRLMVHRKGRVVIPLRCAAATRCRGALTLAIPAGRKARRSRAHAAAARLVSLAHGGFDIAAHRSGRVILRLSNKGRRMLATPGASLAATLLLTAANATRTEHVVLETAGAPRRRTPRRAR